MSTVASNGAVLPSLSAVVCYVRAFRVRQFCSHSCGYTKRSVATRAVKFRLQGTPASVKLFLKAVDNICNIKKDFERSSNEHQL